ncbi:MAG TPA: hypothetical protein VFY63_06425 [Pseudorhizobium sp.]|nr:hypothetical protein [Pseudorhizobium sp.]
MAEKQVPEKTKGGALDVREVQSPHLSDKDLKKGEGHRENAPKRPDDDRS